MDGDLKGQGAITTVNAPWLLFNTMIKFTKILTFVFLLALAYSVDAQQANAVSSLETTRYSLEKLCRKSGKVVLWLGNIDDNKVLALKGIPVKDALFKLCSENMAAYSYDDSRFIFRKLDFLESFGKSDFGFKQTTAAYDLLTVASDESLKLMPDDYKKEALGEPQEGVAVSQLNTNAKFFAQIVASGILMKADPTLRPIDDKVTYTISANVYSSLHWITADKTFKMNAWRSTNPVCSVKHRVIWNSAETQVETFGGTLEEAIRKFGPTDFTIDPRFKSSRLFFCYPEGTSREAIFEQMQDNIPFKSRNLADNIHIFSETKNVTTYRLLFLGDKLYNSSGACAYDGWQQFAYANSPVNITILSASQKKFVNGFIEEHNNVFPEEKIQLLTEGDQIGKGNFSFAPQINLIITRKDQVSDGKSDVLKYEVQLRPLRN